jgi:hypothetical protein
MDLLLFSTQIGEGSKEARKEARVLFEVVCNVGLHFFSLKSQDGKKKK